MDSLRLILIAAGLLIIGAIYLWDRLQKQKLSRREVVPPAPGEDDAPALVIRRGDGGDVDYTSELADLNSFLSRSRTETEAGVGLELPGGASAPDAAEPPYTPPAEPVPGQAAATDARRDEIITLYITTAGGQEIPGDQIHTALGGLGFRYGEMQIFHHYGTAKLKSAVPLFSLVNMYEPGTFDIEHMSRFSTRGMGVFMRIPGPRDPEESFEYMLEICRRLAEKLNAQVLGPDHQLLTQETAESIIRRIREHGR